MIPGVAVSPAIEAVFTIAPPPSPRIAGATCFMPRKTPLRFTAITRSKSSSSSSHSGARRPSMPALLKNASIRPKRATACST